MSYQNVTGPLMANSHPGSYCGQDAYSDMLVTQNEDIFISKNRGVQGFRSGKDIGCAGLQRCDRFNSGNWGGENELSEEKTIVRRLTEKECERLQGFPDNWTSIGEWTDTKGKVHKESTSSSRYKALGNSIALPFWFWLLRRISAQYERPATLGSLFDGISGFPLCWVRCNGTDSVLWTSEIEEFPIAVCKKHFGDEDAGIEGDIKEYL